MRGARYLVALIAIVLAACRKEVATGPDQTSNEELPLVDAPARERSLPGTTKPLQSQIYGDTSAVLRSLVAPSSIGQGTIEPPPRLHPVAPHRPRRHA